MILIPYTRYRLHTDLSAREIREKIGNCTNDADAPGSWRLPAAHIFDCWMLPNGFKLLRKSPGSRRVPPPARVVVTESADNATVLVVSMPSPWVDLVFSLSVFGMLIFVFTRMIVLNYWEPGATRGGMGGGIFFLLITIAVYLIMMTYFTGYVEEYKDFLKEKLSAKEPDA